MTHYKVIDPATTVAAEFDAAAGQTVAVTAAGTQVASFVVPTSPTAALSMTNKNGHIVLSGNNLIATANSGGTSDSAGQGAMAVTTGQKRYWEVKATGKASGTSGIGVGIANSSETFGDGNYVGQTVNEVGYYPSGAIVYNNAVASTYASWGLNDVLCFALDAGNKWWVRVNGGSWNNNSSDNPATNTGGSSEGFAPCFPAYNLKFSTTADQLTFNFGATAFAFTPPSGFTALDGAVAPPPSGTRPNPTSGMPAIGSTRTTDLTLAANDIVVGVTFNGCRVIASNVNNWQVIECIFNNTPSISSGAGSAVEVSGSSGGKILNCDFNSCDGQIIGQFSPDNLTVSGNHFTGCFQLGFAHSNSTSQGRNMKFTNNVFTGEVGGGIEMTGDGEGVGGYLNNLLIDNNWFADIAGLPNGSGGWVIGRVGPVSVVVRDQQGTHITNNFFRLGTAHSFDFSEAVEVNSDSSFGGATPAVSGNLMVDFVSSVSDYGLGHSGTNTVFNSGSHTGDTVLSTRPADPAKPPRVSYS